jgi:HEAT repeat protein
VFGLSPLPRTAEAALRDARDKKAAVRLSALHDLTRYATAPDGQRARRELARALATDVSAQVRGAAALALADAGASDETDALLEALSDAHLRVRQMALIALGELGEGTDERVVSAIGAALADEAPALRFQALIAYSRVAGERAEPAILRGAQDADAEIRHVSLRLLEERATSDEGVRPSEPVLAAARDALDDEALSVRVVAAILLGRAGDGSGSNIVADALNQSRVRLDPEDEHAAISLVGELRIRGAIRGLERRAHGLGFGRHPLAHEALIALARLGESRAKARILRGLRAFTRDARTLAVDAAGRAGLVEAREIIEAMRGNDRRADGVAVERALALLEHG